MSTIPMMPLFSAYDYDPELFDQVTFPAGIDKDVFINSLILEKGDAPLLYPSIEFNKRAFGVWSSKWQHSFERLQRVFTEEYDPLHNFDRHEDYKDVEGKTTEGKENGDSRTTGTSSTTADTGTVTSDNLKREDKVSAYNESEYQPEKLGEETNSGTVSVTDERESETDDRTTSSVDRTGKEDRTLEHTAHLYGNIGVTRSQEMLLDELKLRSAHNLYDAIIEIFANEFLLGIY